MAGACARAWAQADLLGTVRDPSGLAVAGAVVEARNPAAGTEWNTVTGTHGEFQFFALPAGRYSVAVNEPGFAPLERGGIELRVADRVVLELELRVGEVSNAVEVTAAAPLLQTTSGTESLLVDGKKVVTLPLDGRNFVPLIALAPGVALPPGSTASPSLLPRISGSRPRTSEYRYDGIGVLQPEPGQVAFFPIIDAIQEFRVQVSSYSAEYGRSNGGVIQVSTKSGTNSLQGTLFEFFRNQALNARNLFAPAGPKPPFHRNQYGFVLGGPLQRNRTFLFVDWQGTRLRIGNTRISTVPTAVERRGVFRTAVYDPATTRRDAAGAYLRDQFPNNAVPVGRFDQAAAGLLARYPPPNVVSSANNYRRVAVDRTNQDQFDTRLDRYFGEKHRIFGRYSYLRDHSAPGAPLPDGSGAIGSGVIGDTLTRADAVAAEHAWTLSPQSVNQLRFGFTRRGFARAALLERESAPAVTGIPNIPAAAFADAMPVFQIAGFQQLGPPESANARFTTSVTEILDTFAALRSGHSLKFGADVRLERLDVLQPPDPTGLFAFNSVLTGALTPAGAAVANTGNSLASFLLGQVSSFNIDVQQQVLKPRASIAEFFVQDDWSVSRRLSLGLGLRYTLNFPSTESNDRGAVFNLRTQKLDFLGRNGFPRSARKLDWTDFGPRASLAFRVTDTFAVRSGYGLVWIEQAGITTPFTTPLFPFVRSVGQRSPDNFNQAFVLSHGPSITIEPPNPDSGLGQGVFAVDRNTGSGYAQQWNFTLQKTFGQHWSLEAGYLGSKLTRLGVPDTNLNQLPAAELSLGPALARQVPNPFYGAVPPSSTIGGPAITEQQLLRPFPRFTTVTLYRNNIGNSTYHAFQAHVEKRFSAGLTLTAAYTFSKLIDDASSVFDAAILTGPVASFPVADSFNRHLEKDISNGDVPHVLSVGFVYDLPFGRGRRFIGNWEIGGLVRLQSGLPLAVTQLTNFNAFAGYGTQRPNRTGDPALPAGERTTARWFNTGAFSAAPQFAIGNSSRNPLRGPAYQDADLMLGKTFALSDRSRLEFRAEVFNLSNTPPLGQPNGVLGSPSFSSITTAFDPRVFEAAVKLKF